MKYNPNSKYGRKKYREDFQKRYNNMPKKEKDELDSMIWWGRIILFVIVIIVCLIVIALGGKIK